MDPVDLRISEIRKVKSKMREPRAAQSEPSVVDVARWKQAQQITTRLRLSWASVAGLGQWSLEDSSLLRLRPSLEQWITVGGINGSYTSSHFRSCIV